MTAGEIYWVDLPGGAGHAQAGRRPAILVQGFAATTHLATALLVPLTTQLDALRFPGTVLIEANAENGLRRNSVALVFQITATDKRFLGARLGKISDRTLQEIGAALDDIMERYSLAADTETDTQI